MSIDSQRRELQELAQKKGLIIVGEYLDVVESAKDERRPGFQQLLRDLKSTNRGWQTLLLIDTSRLSRRRYMAQVFKHEAKKRGVHIIYSKLPESDPIADMVTIGVMEVFDELHSLMSREKGLAGMAENVRQGYRAGGRAPKGYRLNKIKTGATREGQAVTKSKLEPSKEARAVKRYLNARADGTSRKHAKAEAGLTCVDSTLIGIEWNALTYAGHTVWNVHNEYHAGHGYKGGSKRRPRADWVIQYDTHEGMISTTQAETLIERLQNSSHAKARRTPAKYLFTGMLKTPNGDSWQGEQRKYYRVRAKDGAKGRNVPKDALEGAVVKQVMEDMVSDDFVGQLMGEIQRQRVDAPEDPARGLRKEIVEINGQISKTMDLAAKLENSAPAIRKIDELERRRRDIATEINAIEKAHQAQEVLNSVGAEDIRRVLQGLAKNLEESDQEGLKERLYALISEITLDPASLECRVHYRIKVASPRGCETNPIIEAVSRIVVGGR